MGTAAHKPISVTAHTPPSRIVNITSSNNTNTANNNTNNNNNNNNNNNTISNNTTSNNNTNTATNNNNTNPNDSISRPCDAPDVVAASSSPAVAVVSAGLSSAALNPLRVAAVHVDLSGDGYFSVCSGDSGSVSMHDTPLQQPKNFISLDYYDTVKSTHSQASSSTAHPSPAAVAEALLNCSFDGRAVADTSRLERKVRRHLDGASSSGADVDGGSSDAAGEAPLTKDFVHYISEYMDDMRRNRATYFRGRHPNASSSSSSRSRLTVQFDPIEHRDGCCQPPPQWSAAGPTDDTELQSSSGVSCASQLCVCCRPHCLHPPDMEYLSILAPAVQQSSNQSKLSIPLFVEVPSGNGAMRRIVEEGNPLRPSSASSHTDSNSNTINTDEGSSVSVQRRSVNSRIGDNAGGGGIVGDVGAAVSPPSSSSPLANGSECRRRNTITGPHVRHSQQLAKRADEDYMLFTQIKKGLL